MNYTLSMLHISIHFQDPARCCCFQAALPLVIKLFPKLVLKYVSMWYVVGIEADVVRLYWLCLQRAGGRREVGTVGRAGR